jgi:hypothetical protein
MNRETEAVEEGKESELQGSTGTVTVTVKLGTSDETKKRQQCSVEVFRITSLGSPGLGL